MDNLDMNWYNGSDIPDLYADSISEYVIAYGNGHVPFVAYYKYDMWYSANTSLKTYVKYWQPITRKDEIGI